jgi:mono/diheme cytochrome c family protein
VNTQDALQWENSICRSGFVVNVSLLILLAWFLSSIGTKTVPRLSLQVALLLRLETSDSVKRVWPISLLSFFPVFLFAASPGLLKENSLSPPNQSDLVSQGKYIVEDVAMCVECHTPRDQKGNLIGDEYLNGAPVPVKAPPYSQINWAVKAPAIAGLIGYTKDEGVRLLTAGVTRDGRVPNPPMPPFRMSAQDAEAVVAYLKSLQ